MLSLMLAMAACGSAITPMRPHGASSPVPRPSAAGAPAGPGSPAAGGVLPTGRRDQTDQPIRVALATDQTTARLTSSGNWALYDRTGEHLLVRSRSTDVWTVETRDGMLRATRTSGTSTASFVGPLVARPMDSDAMLSYNGKRYRGEILVLRQDTDLTVINRLDVESYLRGVVPLEIGTDRTIVEEAAVEAQAIAARSYAYTHINDARPYDLTATVADQVYGGADAERSVSDEAIRDTRNLVLMYGGRVVNAPYHANSGGTTAAASEVWRTNDEPYLVSVSDRIPGSTHFYCEQSPKFRWVREFDAASLASVVQKYLPKYAKTPSGSVGMVRRITETGRTPSGRIAGLTFETDRGTFAVRGNDVRFVLRTLGGDILPSTLFTIEPTTGSAGYISRLVVRGTGAGHGVGMDQWGAIARARAGQNYAMILRTYFPGTSIVPIT